MLRRLAKSYRLAERGQYAQAAQSLRETHAAMVQVGDPRADEVALQLREVKAAAPPSAHISRRC
ncbi:hypothetical protein [Amycolatopsis albispora]|uniref:Bacterial transcriptional activator domain-containing protein n=1 Tax=Amycolatopsis albispora TaxID=1804986 RepID=A0A344L9R3_9PSEU|nr:hypothetical protein [Amycolatopsis albispora]AXB44787.1 hypothetical protein A4R43_21675 [Amycolatopsis albispora]